MSYLENAKVALDSLNSVYYKDGSYKGLMVWDRAEMLELLEDACEKIGDEYKPQLQQYIDSTITHYGEDWSSNPYYDDILWVCVAFARAANILNNDRYLQLAKTNLDFVTNNGVNLSGLVEWKKDARGGNTISSTTYVVASSLIGKALSDNTYLDNAKAVLDVLMKELYNRDNGHVFDHINPDGSKEFFAHDSNFGMFIRACSEVYDYTKDESYLAEMKRAAEHLISQKYKSNIMCNHDTGDGAGFKAIFIRQLGYIATKYDIEEYMEWLKISADSAWNNRNKYNLMINDFCQKTADHRLWRVFDCQTAVTLLISCI